MSVTSSIHHYSRRTCLTQNTALFLSEYCLSNNFSNQIACFFYCKKQRVAGCICLEHNMSRTFQQQTTAYERHFTQIYWKDIHVIQILFFSLKNFQNACEHTATSLQRWLIRSCFKQIHNIFQVRSVFRFVYCVPNYRR